jgi:hypothetical protein
MNHYLAKIIYEMVSTSNSPLKTVRKIYVPTQTLLVKMKVYTQQSQDWVLKAPEPAAPLYSVTHTAHRCPPCPRSSRTAEDFELFCGRASLSNSNGGATREGEEGVTSVFRKEGGGVTLYRRGGAAPRGVQRPLEVSPLPLHDGNPPHQMSNPLYYFLFNLHDIHTN